MDLTLYSVTKHLILPPGGLIVLFLLGFLLVRGVMGRVLIFIGLRVTPAPTYFIHRETGSDSVYGDWLPSASAFSTSYYAIHEYLGRGWYQWKATMEDVPATSY